MQPIVARKSYLISTLVVLVCRPIHASLRRPLGVVTVSGETRKSTEVEPTGISIPVYPIASLSRFMKQNAPASSVSGRSESFLDVEVLFKGPV